MPVAEKIDEWITMSDGVRLSGTLYTPESAGPWPVILEGLPYRKDDVTAYHAPEYRRLRDEGDFVVCRVDLRGTGSSEGVAEDEYTPQEQKDLCEVIAWLAAQDWSNGNVGMYGASYGGFNSFQVAMEQPPALKAIVPIYATDDRYTDDVHLYGGTRRSLDLTDYPLYMVAMNALPPVPNIVGPGWRELWDERLATLQPWLLRWLEEQLRDPYWQHGSLRPHYQSIKCPTMIVAGWADGYRNATFRVFEQLQVPKRLLFGPWSHMAPESSLPGPRIDLVPELIKWFDQWLRAAPPNDEPPIAVFIRRSTRPAPDLDEMRGEWRYEPDWPLERGRVACLSLEESAGPRGGHTLVVRGDVGAYGAGSGAGALPAGQPLDQRADEAHSLVYTWPRFEQETEILGYPRVDITLSCTAPIASLSAKLCDVFEDGTSVLVSRGWLNLTHRDSHTKPEALRTGERYTISFDLDATSWVFEAGHALRLDLAGADWPNVWPPPEPLKLTVDPAASTVSLPVVEGPSPVAETPAFAPPPARTDEPLGQAGPVWRFEHDVLRRESRVVIDHDHTTALDDGSAFLEHYWGNAGVSTVDPGESFVTGGAAFELRWDGTVVRAETHMNLRSDKDNVYLELDLDVTENGAAKESKEWRQTHPRHLQ